MELSIILVLHIFGAILTGLYGLYALAVVVRRRGNKQLINRGSVILALTQIVSGAALIIFSSETVSFTRLCVSGAIYLTGIFAVRQIASLRIAPVPTEN